MRKLPFSCVIAVALLAACQMDSVHVEMTRTKAMTPEQTVERQSPSFGRPTLPAFTES